MPKAKKRSEESDEQEVDSKCEVASNEDEDFVIGDEEEDDDDVSVEDEYGGDMGDLLTSVFCTSEGESIADVFKNIEKELHTLNKSVAKFVKSKTTDSK